jgi:ubiquinone/menaquinone biosynthesis C-methylase UbiE
MMPSATHDELAEQLFVAQLKSFLATRVEPKLRQLTQGRLPQSTQAAIFNQTEPRREARRMLEGEVAYQSWLCLVRASQEMLWRFVTGCVDRQLEELIERARNAPDMGSLRLNPDLEIPQYQQAADIHLMPGSYFSESRADDVRQGAVFDRGASIYHTGRAGGAMNDVRGHTLVQHVFDRFAGLRPAQILEVGCSVGNTLVAVAGCFPEAQIHGIDLGAPMLRYAHARASHLGVPIHFSQQNAEQLDFPESSFDFVFSSAVLHETSAAAVHRILAECLRVLRPGGVMLHLEVPHRYQDGDLWLQVRGDYETFFNNEPFWHGACAADFAQLSRDAGFIDVADGYQTSVSHSRRGAPGGFGNRNLGVYRCWYVFSGRKPPC